MVSVQHHFPPLASQDSDAIQHWLNAISNTFGSDEFDLIRRACEFAAPLYHEQIDLTGKPLLQHALGSASILIGLHMDHETIAATALHAVPSHLVDWKEVLTARFGRNVTRLVEGISDMERLRQFSEVGKTAFADKNEASQQVEGLRKMLLAMVEDIRVVLIKLAERTQTLRNLSAATPEIQRYIAQETRSIFAPLANRLGVWQLKWELEDLSLRYLEPVLYKKVAKLLDERRVDRERYIDDVVAQLERALAAAHINAEVSGRPKHIHSIINKMKRKQLEFSELYDVRAIRVLVGGMTRRGEASGAGMPPSASSRNRLLRSSVSEAGDIEQCYAALSITHELWSPIQKEFDDYIAHPKPNGYRSLHTAVLGPRELPFEVQIRTHKMHHDSELGVAAHWRYKENKQSESGFDEKLAWLRQILEWKSELAGSAEFQEQFKNELLQDRVYVFTPQGKVIDLPKGATPVDFAYVVHTDLGHRTRGAKLDGSIVPLNTKLQNGQRVEILTTKQGGPSRDWLSPKLGFLQSARARAKVRHWFSEQNLDDSVAQGRALLDRELHRVGVTDINQEKLAQKLRYSKLDDLLAALGRGDITPRRVSLAIVQETPAPAQRVTTQVVQTQSGNVLIEGVGNLMIRTAKCCNPAKPDAIIGYVTRDRGITIHRRDCPFMQRVPEDREDRLLEAAWSTTGS